MLPPTWLGHPTLCRMWPINAVVVDLPLVPVTATKRAFGSARASSSMSQMIGLPAARAAAATACGLGNVLGMPGLMTSAVIFDQSILSGSASFMPALAAALRVSALSSQAAHSTPAAMRARTVVRPDRASPRTMYDDPWRKERLIMPSPELQGGEADHRQDGGDDPEAEHDGGLGPALLLEVVMQRRHAEDALAGPLEGQHLHDHRYGLEHEQPAHDGQHELVLDHDRGSAERAADRKRPRVAHEHHGRWCVEPQEAQPRADQCRQQHREFAGAW